MRSAVWVGLCLGGWRCGLVLTRATDLGAEYDRSRGGGGPISVRSSTDLEAEVDRSRRGVRPISV